MVVTPKEPRKELTKAQKSRIWTLHEEGYNPTEIWHKTKIPCTTCSLFINRQSISPDPQFENKPRSSRPKKITARGARALVRTACQDTRMSLKALATPSKSGQKLNYYTVTIILKSFGKAKRRPRKKPFLSPLHKKKRQEHCQAEKAIKRNNQRVCWSDEVTFEVGEDLNTFWVTRAARREEEYADRNLRPTFKSGRTTVGV
jgi:transposase